MQHEDRPVMVRDAPQCIKTSGLNQSRMSDLFRVTQSIEGSQVRRHRQFVRQRSARMLSHLFEGIHQTIRPPHVAQLSMPEHGPRHADFGFMSG